MLGKRYKFIKCIAIFLALLLSFNPISVLASEAEEEAVFLEEEDSDLGSYEQPGDGIDAQALYDSIDVEALRASIDVDELMAQIDEEELLALIDEEELKEELARRDAERESQRNDQEIESGTIALMSNEEDDLPPGVTRIEFPIIENNNLFDFIMDPMGLVYMTNAAKYGGGNVEEGATVLFKNTGGDNLFSDTSDYLTFRNKGNTPVEVVIKATITNTGNLEMTSDKTFANVAGPALYLALVDTNGNEIPLSPTGETTIDTVLEGSLQDTSVYRWNYETHSYELTDSAGDEEAGAYHFALTGACNADANWSRVDARPTVKVSWSARALNEEETEKEDTSSDNTEPAGPSEKEESAVDNSTDDASAADSETPSENENASEDKSASEDENASEDKSSSEDESTSAGDEASEDSEAPEGEDASAGDEASEDGEDASSEDNGEEHEKRLTLQEAKLQELRMEKLEELKQQRLQELIEEKLQELIAEEFERLYQEALDNKNHSTEEIGQENKP